MYFVEERGKRDIFKNFDFITFLPILILFFILKNKIMGNLMDGGIKG